MQKSRTYNSIVNSIFGISASGMTVVLNFFVRVILVRQLGAEINGLHTLFQSIISIMAIMEMGISSAMIIHLYEPIKTDNQQQIKGIMSFYRKIYSIIAIIFGVVTIIVSIFVLDHVVTTTIKMSTVRFYFLLFGLSSVLNYFTFHKRSILYAEQKNRISIGVNAGCELFFRSIQIGTLLIYKNYCIFLCLWILEKLAGNLICAYYVNKEHPYLINNHEELNSVKKKEIFETVKPLVINQVAGTVRQSAKSILTSILLGNVAIVGYYGNYQLAINMVELVYSQFGGAITTSFGNLAVERNKDRMRSAYRRSAFVMDWVGCFFCAGFFVCIQDFISMIFTYKSVLTLVSMISLLANMLFYLINIPIISIQNAMGLHRLDTVGMILQSALSIALAYFGGLFYGMPGIFFGLLIPLIIFTTIRKGVIISEYAMAMSKKDYLTFILYELLKMITSIMLTGFVCSLVNMKNPIMNIVIKGFIAMIICAIVTPIMSARTEELEVCKVMMQRVLIKFGKNKGNN